LEIVINPIRSIIVFNPGSAGDFLTALCLTQLYDTELHRQTKDGRILVDTDYFKHTSQQLFYEQKSIDWDLSKLKYVENTHYWSDSYKEIADQHFYIDYPDHLQHTVMQIYLHKIFKNDIDKFLDRHLPSLPHGIRSKIDKKNALEVFNIRWLKSLKAWRSNQTLGCVQLADFFDREKLKSIVEIIIKDKIHNHEKFDLLYQEWMEKNQTIKDSFK
jgi:hypothetical protein